MYWNSFSDFLHMGNHGFYVWGAFGVTALVMLLETWLTLRNAAQTRQRLTRQIRLSALEAARQKEATDTDTKTVATTEAGAEKP